MKIITQRIKRIFILTLILTFLSYLNSSCFGGNPSEEKHQLDEFSAGNGGNGEDGCTDEVVHFQDPNLETEVRNVINKPSGDILAKDVCNIKEFSTTIVFDPLGSLTIRNLTGLEYFVALERLSIFHQAVSDLSPLAGLTKLEYLVLEGNRYISDLSPLAGLTNLETLDLDINQISDLSPLAGLTNLEVLAISCNEISDISPLAELTNLAGLGLAWNQISDISPLARLTNLIYLRLEGNQISDLGPLVANTGLGSEDFIYQVEVDSNPLDNEACTVEIPALEDRGIMVSFDGCCPYVHFEDECYIEVPVYFELPKVEIPPLEAKGVNILSCQQ